MPREPTKEGFARELEALAESLRDANGRLVLSNLREQDLAEAARRERERLQALLEALHDGVVVIDGAGALSMVNGAGRALCNLAGDAGAGILEELAALELRGLDHLPLARDAHPLTRVLRGDRFTELEVLCGLPGDERRLMITGTSIGEGSVALLALLVLRDVTERRALEASVARAERLAALGTLAAGMAHEINNPLTYVLANIDLAMSVLPRAQDTLREVDTALARETCAELHDALEGLRDAHAGGERVRRVVDDVRRFGHPRASEASSVVLADVIDTAVRMTFNVVRHSATLRVTHGTVPAVRADDAHLTQVFVNLLVNAAEASLERGGGEKEIAVSSYVNDAGLVVAEVRDAGPGVPVELQGRVFEPFFTTKALGKGMGLGLSICHSLLASFGGTISVENAEAGGARFRITLTPWQASGVAAVSEAPPSNVPRARVLIIDDEPSVARALARMLRKQHDVRVVTEPEKALSCLSDDTSFDVILCDVMMPGLSGMDLYGRVLATRPELGPKFVFMTGGVFTEPAEAFLAATPNRVLAKPLRTADLNRVVAACVEERARAVVGG